MSGSGTTSRDAQVQEDGNTAGSSVADFFSDQSGAEFFDTKTPSVLGITDATSGTELISLQWPEAFITDTYAEEFPTSTNNVTTITVLDEDGKESLVFWDLLDDFTAINFTRLESGGYTTVIPDSVTSVSTATTGAGSINYHDYLWLFEKDTSAGSTGTVNSRNVAVYKLLSIQVVDSGNKYHLTFRRIY